MILVCNQPMMYMAVLLLVCANTGVIFLTLRTNINYITQVMGTIPESVVSSVSVCSSMKREWWQIGFDQFSWMHAYNVNYIITCEMLFVLEKNRSFKIHLCSFFSPIYIVTPFVLTRPLTFLYNHFVTCFFISADDSVLGKIAVKL